MVKYGMIRLRKPVLKIPFSIPCLAAGLLLTTRIATAQIPIPPPLIVTGPSSPTSALLTSWFDRQLPSKFRAKEQFEVHPLTESQMASYLQDASGDTQSDPNSHTDDGTIDGIFEDKPPRITLLVPDNGNPDLFTFAHEYGHYVWYDLLTKDDRKRYETVYKKQRVGRHLVTRYAETDVEEGFAEAFSFYALEPPLLRHRDGASYQFLSAWPAQTLPL
jgi:hypothetical protein